MLFRSHSNTLCTYDTEADMCTVDTKFLFDYVGLPALETIFTTKNKNEACASSKEMANSADEEVVLCASDSPGMCCCVAVDIFRLFVLHISTTDLWTVPIHITEYNSIGAMMSVYLLIEHRSTPTVAVTIVIASAEVRKYLTGPLRVHVLQVDSTSIRFGQNINFQVCYLNRKILVSKNSMDHHQIFSFRNRIECFWDTLILLILF